MLDLNLRVCESGERACKEMLETFKNFIQQVLTLPIHVWTAKTRGAVVILKDAFHQCSQFQYPFTELEVGEFQFATDTVDKIIHFKYSFVRKDDETDTQVWAELFVQLQLHYMP